ncbi:protein yellow-like [Cylas formicarius]|uniref:protein yellow-like n=1 Tax=Cylas formicarius TaxID=197179 RepID=UPI0029588653|nr:protein yellow-like [Cylas formicarius]
MPRLICLVAVALIAAHGAAAKFKVIREWRYINFTWPASDTYETAVRRGAYVPENVVVAGIKYHDGFYYLTLPRMKEGVPATLARVPASAPDTAPLLTPYPSWEMNAIGDCDALQNVQNVEIDPNKGQIWIIDGGRTETMGLRPVVKCKPKLVVYDVAKNDAVLTYSFPEHVASVNGSFLYDIVVDNTGDGYAYVTDNSGRDPGIIVFSVRDHHSWKIRHAQSMKADPRAVYFAVNGVAVSAAINVASIALGLRDYPGVESRPVFYAPLSSLHLYSINSSALRNEGFADGDFQGQVTDYGLKESQSVGMTMDNRGVLYYSLLGSNSIARWNFSTPFVTGQKIIAKDERYLEWTNSLTFDDAGNLTLLVNRLQRFIYGRLDLREPNFRLISANVGAKGYLYDDQLYNVATSTTTSTTPEPQDTTDHSEEDPVALPPGSDQDPYMAPQPVPEEPQPEPTTSPETEPTAEPEPSPTEAVEVTGSPKAQVSAGVRATVGPWFLVAAVVLGAA